MYLGGKTLYRAYGKNKCDYTTLQFAFIFCSSSLYKTLKTKTDVLSVNNGVNMDTLQMIK